MACKEKSRDNVALDAFIKLKRSTESLSSYAHAILPDFGLNESQFGILQAIDHLGPLCQKELARKILKTPANITLTIDKLEKQGLVVRERNPEDRRYYSICLTSQGQGLIAEVFPLVKKRISDAMEILNNEELEEFARMCKTLGKQSKIA